MRSLRGLAFGKNSLGACHTKDGAWAGDGEFELLDKEDRTSREGEETVVKSPIPSQQLGPKSPALQYVLAYTRTAR